MRNIARLVATVVVFGALAGTAPAAGPRYVTLGQDPAGDAAPSLDLTGLSVARVGNNVDIRFHLQGMVPQLGSLPPALPGVQWAFKVGKRTFVAEAVPTHEGGDYYLFELLPGDRFRQLAMLTGTYVAANNFASIAVPLTKIGAKKGSRLSGVVGESGGDVDFHIHVGPRTDYADFFTTTKSYVVPGAHAHH